MKKYSLIFILFIGLSAEAKTYYFSPSEVVALKQILSDGSLQPGDNVFLRDGIYNDLHEILFQAKGTASDSILLKAEHPGKAIISGAINIKIYGEYLQLEGLCFQKAWALKSGMIDFQKEKGMYASRCRVTQCVIDDCNNPKKSARYVHGQNENQETENWIGMYGWNNRVDHCYFANKTVRGLVLQIWLNDDNIQNNHIVDHNLFGTRKPYGGNGAEIIRVGHSWTSQLESRSIIENNIFFHCDGENEIISVKSCHNILRRNLFFESRGGLVCRHGHYNVIESNTFVGNRIPETLGIRIINQGHTVYDNYLCRLNGFGLLVRVGVFERPTAETDIQNEPLTSYHRVENVDIANNHFVDCKVLEFGSGLGDKTPRNLRFAHNVICNAESNVKVFRSEDFFLNNTFQENKYHFTDGSTLHFAGFTKLDDHHHSEETELLRVKAALTGRGAFWYSPNKETLLYINNKY